VTHLGLAARLGDTIDVVHEYFPFSVLTSRLKRVALNMPPKYPDECRAHAVAPVI
jgi:hypothetical protein